MMRIRPLLKRFTRRKKKNDLADEIQKADKKKKHSVKVRLLAQIKRLKSRKKTKEEQENLEVDKVDDGNVEDITDDPGDIIVHVNPDDKDIIVDDATPEKLEPRETVVNALQITPNEHDKDHTENLKLRIPEVTIDKDIHRRSLDQLISDRLSGVSHDSPLWSRKRLGTNRTASNISIYSKQQHEPFETRTIWTQTELSDNVRNETVEKLVRPSPGGSLGFRLQDIGVGPSPSTSLGVRLETVGVGPSPGSSLDTKLEDVGVGPSPYGSKEFGIETSCFIKPVENPRLAKIKTRILRRLNCPNLDHCEASVCVELLRLPKPPFLVALNRKLSDENALFNVEFLELNGLDYLLILMDYIAEDGLATIFDVLLMLVVSECATSLVNSPAGRDYLLAHGEHVVSMARGKKVAPSEEYILFLNCTMKINNLFPL